MKKIVKNLTIVSLCCTLFFFFLLSKDKSMDDFLMSTLTSFLYTFAIGLGNIWTNRMLNQKYSWITDTKKRVIFGIFANVVVNIVLVVFLNYLNIVIMQGLPSESFWNGQANFYNWIILNIALLISAILHAKGFMEEWKNASKNQVVEQKILATTATSQLESLKNQLDPHFLFNSLNVLTSLIDENPSSAQRFTESMSKIYRYVLEQKEKELVTLEEELSFARTYSELLKTRFEDSVDFIFQIGDNVEENYVVPLSLQLLLENAIKHNHATEANPLIITISVENRELLIKNNLSRRDIPKEREGIGLSNIVQRYAMLTVRKVIIEENTSHFVVRIPILKEKISPMQTSESQELIAYEKASKRIEELKGFYGNLISYIVFIPFLFFINWRTSPEYWWAFYPMAGWGIGVISHAIQTFGIGKDWEEKQIEKMVRKQKEAEYKWK